ncbi:hypothetical protein FRB93_011151 [Tulasnella sp. JGI-2019a]|nr:hypothetical protein FRB93_011151 [Tulasnella sp. JGI-2019a]
MDYFSKLIRGSAEANPSSDYVDASEFNKSWKTIESTLLHPDERQLSRGVQATGVPMHLQAMTDALVRESTQYEDSTGPCLEFLLKNDVLTSLVRLSESDRPFGIQAEVLRTISTMVVQLDERFLVHTGVHKAVIRLLRTCVGDEIPDGPTAVKSLGAAGSSTRISPSDYEEDLVNLLCILCSRIRTYPDLLMIFFHEQNWFHPRSPLGDIDELEEEEEDPEEEEDQETAVSDAASSKDLDTAAGGTQTRSDTGDVLEAVFDPSATPTKHSVLLEQTQLRANAPTPPLSPRASTSAQPELPKPQYEFLIFNYLMRFIHREGTVGEFGRAGLLFLLDIAMASEEMQADVNRAADDPVADAASALCDYLLESDFAEVLSAGLGAVYSLLPYRLEVKQDNSVSGPSNNPGGGGMILGVVTTGTVDEEKKRAEDEKSRIERLGTEVSTSVEFRARLDHFLKLVEFVQDVLRRLQIGSIAAPSEPNNAHRAVAPSRLSSRQGTSASLCQAITLSILDSVRSIFLQNVLYPSILECSDIDRSAVAVMSYIGILLQTIRSGLLCDVLIDFLMMDEDEDLPASRHQLSRAPPRTTTKKSTKRERRRSSAMMLLSMEAPNSTEPSSYFNSLGRFTLKDLLITNLDKSSTAKAVSQQTGVAALTLLHTLMTEYCEQSTEGLFSVIRDSEATSFPAPRMILGALDVQPTSNEDADSDSDDEEFQYLGADSEKSPRQRAFPHPRPTKLVELFPTPSISATTKQNECGLYRELVNRINPPRSQDPFSTMYDYYLQDAVDVLQSQCCYAATREGTSARSDGRNIDDHKHRLRPADPMIKALVHSLRRFFTHSPEFNVALTGVIADVCACPHRSVAGWLTLAPEEEEGINAWSNQDRSGSGVGNEMEALDGDDNDDERSIDFAMDKKLQSESRTPAFDVRLKDPRAMPILYTVLSGLVAQLDHFRMFVDDFDELLSERRKGLLFTEHLNDALSLALEPSSLDPEDSLGPSSTKTQQKDTPTPSRTAALPGTPESPPAPSKASARPKAKSGTASFISSFLTTKKKSTVVAVEADPSKQLAAKALPASPFAPHYLKTSSVEVQVSPAPPPTSGPWSPIPLQTVAPNLTAGIGAGGFDDSDMFMTRESRPESLREEERPSTDDLEVLDEGKKISLSQLLDNVVILEEVIKELAAIMEVRAGMGIDSVKYV